MIYFLRGENSYAAIKKINEFKEAFRKKNESFLIEETDGEDGDVSEAAFYSALGQGNLFTNKRLVIFKNVFVENEGFLGIFEKNADALQRFGDIFVFWERKPSKETSSVFEKYSEKVQEVPVLKPADLDKWFEKKIKAAGLKIDKNERALMIEEAGEGSEWALEGELEKIKLGATSSLKSDFPGKSDFFLAGGKAAASNPFVFVERMFGPRALFAVKELKESGQDVQRFIYILLWKLKQKRMAAAYFEGIKAESQMRREPKNAEEILERFISSLRV